MKTYGGMDIQIYVFLTSEQVGGELSALSSRIILQWILKEMGWGGTDRIDLAQDMDQCRVLVNTVMDLRVK
jgi:hypothetical protein